MKHLKLFEAHNVYTLESMLRELDSFVPCEKYFNAASKSGITTANNKELAKLVKDWGNGVYDNDPDYMVSGLVALLPKHVKENGSFTTSNMRSVVNTKNLETLGVSGWDIEKILEICADIANEIGDSGTCVIGGGLIANGKKIVSSYSQGNTGPEKCYTQVRDFLKKKYPDIKCTIEWGNMD